MLASYISPEEYPDSCATPSTRCWARSKGDDIPDFATFALIAQSLTTIDDIFCELVFDHGGNSGDDVALRGYLHDFARSKLRRVLHFVVDDAHEPATRAAPPAPTVLRGTGGQ